MKQIPLSNGGSTTVDDEWYPVLSQWSWSRSVKGYAQRSVKPGFSIMMHQIVAMTPKALFTDHINNDKLDNRQVNLRVCTNAENARSRKRKPGRCGYRGVTLRPNGRFEASIMVNYKSKSLGVFDTALEAAIAYDTAAIAQHRSFATLNFPCDTAMSQAFQDE
jgi:hypothetical protein